MFSIITSAFFAKVLDKGEAALGFEVDRDRLLVGVELEKIIRVRPRPPGEVSPAGLAALWVLDLDDLGTEPGERFGAGGTRLELRQVEDTDTGQALQGCIVFSHKGQLH